MDTTVCESCVKVRAKTKKAPPFVFFSYLYFEAEEEDACRKAKKVSTRTTRRSQRELTKSASNNTKKPTLTQKPKNAIPQDIYRRLNEFASKMPDTSFVQFSV